MAPKKKEGGEQKLQLGRPKGTLKMGLVGLPNVGKSSTFNLLSKQAVPAENFPFCTIDPHEARMCVPDERFLWLVNHYKPKSEAPASLAIFDIAGLVPGAHKGEGLGNAFLSHIQSVDGIYHVVRGFDDEDIIHTDGSVDPVRDLQTISDELRYKDIARVRKIYEDLENKVPKGGVKPTNVQSNQLGKADAANVKGILSWLEDEKKWITTNPHWTNRDIEILNNLTLLTAKPIIYLVNLDKEAYKHKKSKYLKKIFDWTQANLPGPLIPYSVQFESELLEALQAKTLVVEDEAIKAGVKPAIFEGSPSQLPKMIATGYETLSLIHYFTSGADEVKCWTVRQGTKAPQAAGIIHTDMENGFICAEVTKCSDLQELGSEPAVKAAGKVSTKGKDYVVEDGDIMFFKFNPSGGGAKK